MKKKILILSLLLSSMLLTIANADTIREPKEWNGWWYNGAQWEYFSNNNKLTNGWNKIDNKWYYFNTDASMTIGWKQIGDKWYFFNNNGSMAHDTTIGGYYLNSSGVWAK